MLIRYHPPALDEQYKRYLILSGCSPKAGLECLRRRSSSVLTWANRKMVEASPWGQFIFGPAVDGSYVQDLPGRALLNGHYVKDIQILIGHTK